MYHTKTMGTSSVQNRNNCNDFTNILSKQLRDAFEPFMGKKVRKISGYKGWMKQTQKIVDQYVPKNIVGMNDNDRCVIYASYTSLICSIKLWDPSEKVWAENDIYIGRFDDETGILTALNEPTEYPTDLTLDAFYAAQNKARELTKLLSEQETILKEYRVSIR